LLIGCIAVSVIIPAFGDENPKAKEPVLVTSCGQSPGPLKMKIFMKRMKLDFDYNLHANVADLKVKKEQGKPYQTMIIVTGASLKGMGAAGISIDDELKRITDLLEEAKKQNIMVISAHIEGLARRSQGASAGDNSDELSIDAVCPNSAMIIVRKDGNGDGRFTKISNDSNIPLMEFDKNLELGDLLKSIFE